ncbi:uncharacterized protein DC041_0004835 [Schistosoma bovis]|uniref:Uncharacterized protein n=1 Tax=Schistosoma bovis TaxID=6184 RepID=A0A430PYX3_SCHBO|nr:uncharacterized protein DC041_0004835 [Schistosoma bovis]
MRYSKSGRPQRPQQTSGTPVAAANRGITCPRNSKQMYSPTKLWGPSDISQAANLGRMTTHGRSDTRKRNNMPYLISIPLYASVPQTSLLSPSFLSAVGYLLIIYPTGRLSAPATSGVSDPVCDHSVPRQTSHSSSADVSSVSQQRSTDSSESTQYKTVQTPSRASTIQTTCNKQYFTSKFSSRTNYNKIMKKSTLAR